MISGSASSSASIDPITTPTLRAASDNFRTRKPRITRKNKDDCAPATVPVGGNSPRRYMPDVKSRVFGRSELRCDQSEEETAMALRPLVLVAAIVTIGAVVV